MSDKRMVEVSAAVSFTNTSASSQVFATLFRDGMALVEETASYLDGAGRANRRNSSAAPAAVYATGNHAPDHAADAACVMACCIAR